VEYPNIFVKCAVTN